VLPVNKRHLPSTTLVSASWWPERPGVGRRAVPEPGRHANKGNNFSTKRQ